MFNNAETFAKHARGYFAWWALGRRIERSAETEWGVRCFNLLPGKGMGDPVVFREEDCDYVGIWDAEKCTQYAMSWEEAMDIISDLEVEFKMEEVENAQETD